MPPSKSLSLGLATALLLAAGGAYWKLRAPSDPLVHENLKAPAPKPDLKNILSAGIPPKEFRESLDSSPAEAASAQQAGCRQAWSEFFETSDDAWMVTPLVSVKKTLSNPCLVLSVPTLDDKIQKACFTGTATVPSLDCLAGLLLAKAVILDRLMKGQDPRRSSLKVLAFRLVGIFSDGSVASRVPEAEAIVDAVIEKSPDLYAGRKAKVVVETLKASTAEENKESWDPSLLADAVQKALDFGIDDPDLTDAAMFPIFSRGNPDEIEAEISRFKSKLSHAPRTIDHLTYAEAYVAWKRKDRDLALSKLDEVIARDPKDERARKTREGILKAKAVGEGKLFELGVSVNFDHL